MTTHAKYILSPAGVMTSRIEIDAKYTISGHTDGVTTDGAVLTIEEFKCFTNNKRVNLSDFFASLRATVSDVTFDAIIYKAGDVVTQAALKARCVAQSYSIKKVIVGNNAIQNL